MELNLEQIIDILRANEMHETNCEWLKVRKAQLGVGVYLYPRKCTCWLSKEVK